MQIYTVGQGLLTEVAGINRYLYNYTISCILNSMKPVIWMGSSKGDLIAFPEEVRREIGYQLEHVQEGMDPED